MFYFSLYRYLGSNLPELQKDTNPVKDVGLRGEVLTGENSETENDLIRYSNYISGAGSTFGGFVADFPASTKAFISGTIFINISKIIDFKICLLRILLRVNRILAKKPWVVLNLKT